MDAMIAWVAQNLLWVMAAGFAVIWLFAEDRQDKVRLGVQAVLGLVLALTFMYVAKSVHHDPRPFVENPRVRPLFQHGPDDGFPSDHSVAAGLLALLVFVRHRLAGLVFVAVAAAIAWARVAAHVHHLQDVVAGLLLGGLAAAVAIALAGPALTLSARWLGARRRLDAAEG